MLPQDRPHKWIAPPPGAGDLEVCEQCGVRRLEVNERQPCTGRTSNFASVQTDYDPFEGE